MPLLCQWRNEPDTRFFMEDTRIVTIPVMTVWYRKILRQDTIYAYIASARGIDFGYLEFKNINSNMQTCEFGTFLDSQFTGAGMGLYSVLCGERILEALKLSDFLFAFGVPTRIPLNMSKNLALNFRIRMGIFLSISQNAIAAANNYENSHTNSMSGKNLTVFSLEHPENAETSFCKGSFPTISAQIPPTRALSARLQSDSPCKKTLLSLS